MVADETGTEPQPTSLQSSASEGEERKESSIPSSGSAEKEE